MPAVYAEQPVRLAEARLRQRNYLVLPAVDVGYLGSPAGARNQLALPGAALRTAPGVTAHLEHVLPEAVHSRELRFQSGVLDRRTNIHVDVRFRRPFPPGLIHKRRNAFLRHLVYRRADCLCAALCAGYDRSRVAVQNIQHVLLVGYLSLLSAHIAVLRKIPALACTCQFRVAQNLPFLRDGIYRPDERALSLVFHDGVDLVVHVLSLVAVVPDGVRSALGEPLIMPHALDTVLGKRIVYRLPDCLRNIPGDSLGTRRDDFVRVLPEKPVLCKLL